MKDAKFAGSTHCGRNIIRNMPNGAKLRLAARIGVRALTPETTLIEASKYRRTAGESGQIGRICEYYDIGRVDLPRIERCP